MEKKNEIKIKDLNQTIFLNENLGLEIKFSI